MLLIDTHCHLDAASFDADRDAVMRRARDVGVTRQVIPAINRQTWDPVRFLCEEYEGLYPAYGFHPMYLDDQRHEDMDALRTYVETHQTYAIGECGLDFYVDGLDADEQKWFFEQQLRIARDFELPVIVHARRAVDQVLSALRRFTPLTGVVHSFPGSYDQASRLHDLGFKISLGGPITYERANKLRGLIRKIGLDWLMLESDAPDQPDSQIRGQRNEPARVRRICEEVALLRDEDEAHIARVTTDNAIKLFRLPA